MKRLRDIIDGSDPIVIKGNPHQQVESIRFDSRRVEPGSLFVALRGTASDGHQFIDLAIEKGATAVVCEELPGTIREGVCYIGVNDSHEALGHLASAFYEHPSRRLNLVGITGTNGKTTSVTLLHRLFRALGYQTGLLSTIRNQVNETVYPATHTTPDPVQINQLLAQMVAAGCEYCFMEVSSHAVDQRRISGLTFRGGAFTNLTHDHLDYHKSFDAYLRAKKRFFDTLPSDAFALINKDDRNGQVMLQNTKAWKYGYSLQSMADFHCRILENQFQGLLLEIDGNEAWFRLTGTFNAYNLLLVYAIAVLLGQDRTEVLTQLSSLEPVEGRFNTVRSETGVTAIVDYAHTPDALKNVLETINAIRTGNEQLITVVGAGGNRDSAKRPLMARIACGLSSRVILTSDNPRNEEPSAILAEMLGGVEPHQKSRVLVIENRREAIKTACALATPGDILLVAGKGHENYQEIQGVKHHFDDREELQQCFGTGNPEKS